MIRAGEKVILKAALELLSLYGFQPRRINSGALLNPRGRPVPFGFKGCPDIYAMVPNTLGRVCWVETKRPGRRPTPEQAAVLESMRASGGVAIWCDNLGTLDRVLKKLLVDPEARFQINGEEE